MTRWWKHLGELASPSVPAPDGRPADREARDAAWKRLRKILGEIDKAAEPG